MIKSPGSASQLNESYNKFLAKCKFLHCSAQQLALTDEANAQTWLAAQDQLHRSRTKSSTSMEMLRYNLAWQHRPRRQEELPQEPQGSVCASTSSHAIRIPPLEEEI